MLVGYARVSTQEQDLALQLDALTAAGCKKVYEEKASGAQRERPELKAAFYLRQGDTLVVVWKLLYSGKIQVCAEAERLPLISPLRTKATSRRSGYRRS
jgi:predicted site-specific integrase-resolvase